MKNCSQSKWILIIIFLSLLFFASSFAYAVQSIDRVVVEVEGSGVVISITEYGLAVAAGSGNQLYDYISGAGTPLVLGVVSGDKYIGISNYGLAFASEGSVTGAVNTAEPIPEAQVSTYQLLQGFDLGGIPILVPVISVPPASDADLVLSAGSTLQNQEIFMITANSGVDEANAIDVAVTIAKNNSNTAFFEPVTNNAIVYAYADNGAGGGNYSEVLDVPLTSFFDFSINTTLWIKVVAEDAVTTKYYKLAVEKKNSISQTVAQWNNNTVEVTLTYTGNLMTDASQVNSAQFFIQKDAESPIYAATATKVAANKLMITFEGVNQFGGSYNLYYEQTSSSSTRLKDSAGNDMFSKDISGVYVPSNGAVFESFVVSADGSQATVTFSEGVYALSGDDPVNLHTRIDPSSSGGTAILSGWDGVHTPNEDTATLYFFWDGALDGNEIVTIKPYGLSIFNAAGIPMDFYQEISASVGSAASKPTFNMVMVPVGSYTFPTGLDDSTSETINGGFFIGDSEVTYELWYAVRVWAETNGYNFQNLGRETIYGIDGDIPKDAKQNPVVHVDWWDAIVWLNALSEKEGLEAVYRTSMDQVIRNSAVADPADVNSVIQTQNNGYRLPISMEWEMVARWIDGTQWTSGSYASGASADYTNPLATSEVAWYVENSEGSTRAVKTKTPNSLGIYDMSGNVYEWTYSKGIHGGIRIRGGSWAGVSENMRIGSELVAAAEDSVTGTTGLRIVRDTSVLDPAPQVVSTTPLANVVGVPVNPQISVTFDVPLVANALENIFSSSINNVGYYSYSRYSR